MQDMLPFFILAFYLSDVAFSQIKSCKDDYKYKMGRGKIGAGGQATVVKARVKKVGTRVAMKIFKREEFFTIEFNLLNQLMANMDSAAFDNSRCFPKIFGACEIPKTKRKAIVMERLEKDFVVVVREMNPTFSDLLAYTQQILECVSELHNHGFVHLDLKLSNIMLAYDNKVKIVDFGMAIPIEHEETLGVIGGTVAYTPPETLMPDDNMTRIRSVKADAWATGLLLFALFSGKLVVGYDVTDIVFKCLSKTTPPDLEQKFYITYFVYKCIFDTDNKLSRSEAFALNYYKADLTSCCLFRLPRHISREGYRNCDRTHWLVQEYQANLKWINDKWEASGVSTDERTFLFNLLRDLIKFNHIERITVNDALLNPLFTQRQFACGTSE